MRLIVLILALAVSACATRVNSDVTAFHTMTEAPRGKTFFMTPTAKQEGSLEWRSYANMVAQRLEKNGLVRANSMASADYAVFLRYAIDGGTTSVSSTPITGMTNPGGTSTTVGMVGSTPVYGSTYTPPTYGIVGYSTDETTTYGRAVRIDIVDIKQTAATRKVVSVYEATATSSGSIGNLNTVMPSILDGVFTDWPGVPGTTQRRSVPLREH